MEWSFAEGSFEGGGVVVVVVAVEVAPVVVGVDAESTRLCSPATVQSSLPLHDVRSLPRYQLSQLYFIATLCRVLLP